MNQPLSDCDVWAFKRTESGWVWRRTSADGQFVLQAGIGHRSLEECVANAQRYGYLGCVSGLPDVRRAAPPVITHINYEKRAETY
jgi:hypothetical protein